jgi:hypothetical protein
MNISKSIQVEAICGVDTTLSTGNREHQEQVRTTPNGFGIVHLVQGYHDAHIPYLKLAKRLRRDRSTLFHPAPKQNYT